jgi:biopolymer transport protein ExbD
MASWDIFHADRLELERHVGTDAIREALAQGAVQDDDLARPAGTNVPWARIGDLPELIAPLAAQPQPPITPPPPDQTGPGRQAPSGSPVERPIARQSHDARPAEGRSRKEVDGPGDFEIVADEEQPSPPPQPTLRAPDWVELRAESDDVAFPVIRDESEPVNKGFADRGPSRPESPIARAPAWTWADEHDEDDDEEDEDHADEEEESVDAIVLDDDGDHEDDQLEILDDDDDVEQPQGTVTAPIEEGRSSRVALPVVAARGWDDTRSDEEAALEEEEAFSLSRSGPITVEELDLAPMVDVAFQLVLFFMVTATTVLYKTLEIPKPSAEAPPSEVTQGRSRSLDDYKNDYILVEIDAAGMMKIDREPVSADMATLVERLRSAREKTGRKSMLLSADHVTRHRRSVLAYDAANEIGLGIVIARPPAPQGPAPAITPPTAPQPAAAAPPSAPSGARPPPS